MMNSRATEKSLTAKSGGKSMLKVMVNGATTVCRAAQIGVYGVGVIARVYLFSSWLGLRRRGVNSPLLGLE